LYIHILCSNLKSKEDHSYFLLLTVWTLDYSFICFYLFFPSSNQTNQSLSCHCLSCLLTQNSYIIQFIPDQG
jgi:hypothetical protein